MMDAAGIAQDIEALLGRRGAEPFELPSPFLASGDDRPLVSALLGAAR